MRNVSMHTPGPWKWAYGGLNNGKELETREEYLEWCGEIWDKTTERGKHMNCVYDESESLIVAITGNGPTGEENAKLISKAPDMLAELRKRMEE